MFHEIHSLQSSTSLHFLNHFVFIYILLIDHLRYKVFLIFLHMNFSFSCFCFKFSFDFVKFGCILLLDFLLFFNFPWFIFLFISVVFHITFPSHFFIFLDKNRAYCSHLFSSQLNFLNIYLRYHFDLNFYMLDLQLAD